MLSKTALDPYRAERNASQRAVMGNVLCVRTEHAVTCITSDLHPHIQIVLRCYQSPNEVLLGFDIDSCCFGYDGKKVYGLPRAIRSVMTATNLVDPTRQSKTYESRYIYTSR